MPAFQTSVSCGSGFENCYEKKVGQKYSKAENDIYNKLCKYGNENAAIKLAEQKLTEQIRNGVESPSKMCPCTTLHLLVNEIKNKI